MKYNPKDYKNLQAAKARLEKAIKRVKASDNYKEGRYSAEAHSLLAQSMLPHLKKNSMKALHIYEADLGGWHADIELRGMPPGINSVMGTPVASPCETREEAERLGDLFVATVLSFIEGKVKVKETDPILKEGKVAFFEFHGASFPLPIEMLEFMKTVAPNDVDETYAKMRLKDMEALYVVNGKFDSEKWDKQPRETQLEFISVLVVAMLNGFLRWPPNEAAPPKSARH